MCNLASPQLRRQLFVKLVRRHQCNYKSILEITLCWVLHRYCSWMYQRENKECVPVHWYSFIYLIFCCNFGGKNQLTSNLSGNLLFSPQNRRWSNLSDSMFETQFESTWLYFVLYFNIFTDCEVEVLRSWDADKGELVCHCDLKCSVREEKELLHQGLASDWSSSASAAEMASPDWRTGQWTSWDGSRLSRELDILILTILLNIGQTENRGQDTISVSVLDCAGRRAAICQGNTI